MAPRFVLCNHKHDFMLREYEKLPQLIAHWDSHFWVKSQFFFAVESVFLAAGAVAFKKTLLQVNGDDPGVNGLVSLVGLCVFNFWLNYVWFRTNRSNREYLTHLFKRARAIERTLVATSPDIPPEDNPIFTGQWNSLQQSESNRGSSWWEIHLPTGFAISWAVVLVRVASFSPHWLYFDVAMGIVLAAFIIMMLVELAHPKRLPPQ